MKYEEFEQAVLTLAHESDVELTPATVAYQLKCSVKESKMHLEEMLQQGALQLDSDDNGNLFYRMGGRPSPAVGQMLQLRRKRSGRERAAIVSSLVVPGSGSLLLGARLPGAVQLVTALTAVTLLARFHKDFGDAEHLPWLVLTLAGFALAWGWGLATALSGQKSGQKPSETDE